MATSRFTFLFFAALVAVGCVGSNSTLVRAADAGPLWLVAADGSRADLGNMWRTHKVNVLVFWSSQCPCVRRYQSRVDALLRQFPADQVWVTAVSSNAGETLEDDIRTAKERGVKVPITRDEGGQVARAVGAFSTPTVVVVDSQGIIRYRGWIDNERLPGDPERDAWLEHAINGILQGSNEFASRSPVYGCTITRSLFGATTSSCCDKH